MGIIGFSVGILGFLLHQIIDIISEFKWELTSFYIQKQDFTGAFTLTVGYSLIFLVASSILVLYQPASDGSGILENIGFLHGTRIKDILELQTLNVKSLSCVFVVGCGMPCSSESFKIQVSNILMHTTLFSRFRNSEDRINFIAAGAAAGIASAFGAPVCGLLFATEEVFFVCGKTSFPGKVSSVAQPCN